MNRPVDEKIVVMTLDNSDFTKKAAETTSIFGKLKQHFSKAPDSKLGNTVKDLNNIQQGVENIDVNMLNKAVTSVTGRFSTLGVVAVSALNNITNRAVDAGISLTKSLTLDQVTSGFSEYETKIGAIGTMLSNTEWAGSTLDDVKATLEELNAYADNTVYSFGDMTENIGRFTAAGVRLEDSAIAIKGLGNLAAASGADVNQLNTAMYQVSQGLAAGRFGLEDWNSMVNAGMGGKKTQDALLATAKAMGINVDMSDGFRMSLQQGWVTSEVFLATLKKFGEDESMTEAATAVRTFSGMMDSLKESIGSGWAMSWEYIFGDFEEATKFWTDMSTNITSFTTRFTESRNSLLKGIKDGGGIDDMFDGIGNAIKPIGDILGAIGDGFSKAFPPMTVDKMLSLIDSFKEFTAGLTLSEQTISSITTVAHGLFSIFDTAIEIVKQLAGVMVKLIPPQLGGGILGLLENIANLAIGFNQSVKDGNFLTGLIDFLGVGFEGLGAVIGGVVDATSSLGNGIRENIGPVLEWLVKTLSPIGDMFTEAFSEFSGTDALGAATVASVLAVAYKLYNGINGLFDGDDEDGLFGGVKEALEGVTDSLQAFTSGIKIANLVLIAGALTLIAVSLKMLEGIDVADLSKGLTALTIALGVMMGAVAIISKFNIVGGMGAATTIVTLAIAVKIMAGALKDLSSVDPEAMRSGISGLVVTVTALTASMIAMSKMGGKVAVGSAQLLALSTSVMILTKAIESLSKIKSSSLIKALGALTLILAQVALFAIAMNGVKLGPATAASIVAISASLIIITKAVESLAGLSVEELAKGLTSIALILAQIAIFSTFAGGPQMLLAGAGITLIATALNMIVGPITTLASMTLPELAKGLGAMAIALTAVVLAGTLGSGMILGSVGILAMSVALNMLVIPIQKMASLSIGQIALGIGGLAAAMVVLGLAAGALTPTVPAILGFSAAILGFGAAVALVGVGISLFAGGLVTLSTLTLASVTAIVSALALLIKGLGALIPAVVKFVVELGKALITGIGELATVLIVEVLDLVEALLSGIESHLPKFLKSGLNIVLALINGIGGAAPQLIDAGMELVVDLINGIANAIENNGSNLTASVLNLVGEILILVIDAGAQIISAFFGWIPGVNEAMGSVTSGAEQFIRDNFSTDDIGTEKGEAFAEGLSGTTGSAENAGSALSKFAESGLSSVDPTQSGVNFGQGFANGISSGGILDKAISAASSLASAALTAINNTLVIKSPSRKTTKSGEETGQGFANGMKNKKKTVAKSAKSLAEKAQEQFDKASSNLELKLEDGSINSHTYVSKMNSLKKQYSGYANIVRDANDKIFAQEKAILENKKYYNNLNLKQELAIWNRLNKQYKKGSEEQLEIEREIYRVKNELRDKDYNDTKSRIDTKKYYNQMSLDQELAAYRAMYKKLDKSSEEAAEVSKEIYRVKQELRDKEFNDEKKKIDTKKYYNQMSLEEELAAWRAMYKGLNKSTEEAKEVSREIYRVKQELRAKEVAEFKSDLDTKKYYNKLSLKDELNAWNQHRKKFKVGTDERIEADKEVYRLKNEIYKQTIAINEDYTNKIIDADKRLEDSIKSVNEERQNGINSLADSFSNFAGIFDEVNKSSDISGAKLLDNLRGQVTTMTEWTNNLAKLKNRGLDEDLLDVLGEMGPSAAANISALTTLTDLELTEYAGLWKSKNEIAKIEAIKQLDDLNKNADDSIAELRANAETELELYKKEWVDKISELKDGTKEEFIGIEDDMNEVGKRTVQGMIDGITGLQPELKKKAGEIASVVTGAIGDVLGDANFSNIKDEFLKTIGTTFNSALTDDNKVDIEAVISYTEVNRPELISSSIPAPDTSYSRNINESVSNAASIFKRDNQESNKTSSGDTGFGKILDSIKGLADRPIVTQVNLDGKEMATVVSKHQYSSTTQIGYNRGVIV